MPAALTEVVGEFLEVTGQDKLQLLLEFANDLPELPAHLEEAAMEPVPECQSPLFLAVEDPAGTGSGRSPEAFAGASLARGPGSSSPRRIDT